MAAWSSPDRAAAFDPVHATQLEIAITIDDKRSLNHSTRTVVLNRRRSRANN